jgi:hypothetical protein
MDLVISGSADWSVAANGVLMSGGKVGTQGDAQKLIDALKVSNQSTFEIWVEATNLNQSGPARMISIGGDVSYQNYVLGQVGDDIEVRLLHTGKDAKSKPRLTTSDGFLTTELTHLVHAYDGTTERIYVNGVGHPTAIVRSGNYANWDINDKLNIGNEATSDRPWHALIRLVAVYDRALSPAEVGQNFGAGPYINGE